MTDTSAPTEADYLEGLDIEHIDQVAAEAADSMAKFGCASVQLTPGDMTTYGLLVVDQQRLGVANVGGRYALASTFGRLRALPPAPFDGVVAGYLADSYLLAPYRDLATATPITAFLHALGPHLENA